MRRVILKVLDRCFSERKRECSRCPAHPINGGPCCYADPRMFASDDLECRRCTHFVPCRKMIDWMKDIAE